MTELSDVTSKAHAEVSLQVSFDMKDVENVNDEDEFDETDLKEQRDWTFCMKIFICILLCATIIFAIVGSVIYFTVLKTYEQPLLASDTELVQGSTKGTTPDKITDEEQVSPETITDDEYICPQNWTYYNKKCYLFSREPVHISGAKEFCSSEGGTQLNTEFEDKTTEEFLMTELRNWIGCCRYYRSMRSEGSDNENMEEEKANSGSLPHNGELNIIDGREHVADDSSKSPTPSAKIRQNLRTTNLPSTAMVNDPLPKFIGRLPTIGPFTGYTSTFQPETYTSTPTSEYGFWLGACQRTHHTAVPSPSPSPQPQLPPLPQPPPQTQLPLLPPPQPPQTQLPSQPPPSPQHQLTPPPQSPPQPQPPLQPLLPPSLQQPQPPPQQLLPPSFLQSLLPPPPPQPLLPSPPPQPLLPPPQPQPQILPPPQQPLTVSCRRYKFDVREWLGIECHGSFVQICERNSLTRSQLTSGSK